MKNLRTTWGETTWGVGSLKGEEGEGSLELGLSCIWERPGNGTKAEEEAEKGPGVRKKGNAEESKGKSEMSQ